MGRVAQAGFVEGEDAIPARGPPGRLASAAVAGAAASMALIEERRCGMRRSFPFLALPLVLALSLIAAPRAEEDR